MSEPTDQPTSTNSTQPNTNEQIRVSRVLSEPATVEACQRDYAEAADIRARLDKEAGQ